jgi:hypothetical protein
MGFADFYFGDGGRRLYLVSRGIIATLTLVASALGVAVGSHRALLSFSDRGPAVVVHELQILSSRPGQIAEATVTFDKIRDCQNRKVTLLFTDALGKTKASELSWSGNTFPLGNGIVSSFDFYMPRGLAPGRLREIRLSAWHGNCSDGTDPDGPAVFSVKNVEVFR